jgi:hypothetical protein
MPLGLKSALMNVLRSRAGSVAIQVAVSITVIIGLVALGTEITFVLYKHRQMQSVADSAALGSATAITTGYPADYSLEARAIASSAGFVDGIDGVRVTVLRPPTIGHYAGNSGAVEVVVSQPQTLGMVSLFRSEAFAVSASAVALVGGAGSYCVLQLSPTNSVGVTISNGAIVNLTQCGLAVDATGSSALTVIGGATLNTLSVSVAGGTVVSNGGVINATNGVKTYQESVADPYSAIAQPTYSGCNYNNKVIGYKNTRQYLSPGVYCNGLAFGNGAIVTMNPGVYVIDRGTFDVGGGANLTATGVTVFLTSKTGSGYAKVALGGGATITMSAMTSGATAGILFFGARNAPLTNSNNFAGGVSPSLTGALYFPSQTVVFSNGVSNPIGCTQLIAGKIQFKGGSKFQNNCSGTGVSAIGGSNSALVE